MLFRSVSQSRYGLYKKWLGKYFTKIHKARKEYTLNRYLDKGIGKKVEKGARRMPRLSEAKKDAISCEKHRGSANRN